jgi:AcrR family transcriptional regulator
VSRVPRPREYDDQLRIRLIEEAARLLVDEGPAAVTTRRVATAVGTSTTAIYSLIGSKDDLIQAVCEEGFARLAAHLATVEVSEDPLDDLRRLSNAYFDMAIESPALYQIMFGQNGTEISATDERPGVATLTTLVDAVGRAVDADLLDGEPFTIAVSLWAMGHGVTSLALTGMLGPPEAARTVLEQSGRAMITGLRNPEAVRR